MAAAERRDAGPTAPRRDIHKFYRARERDRMAENRHPAWGICGARRAQRVEPDRRLRFSSRHEILCA